MNKNISALKVLLGFQAEDALETLKHRSFLQAQHDRFHTSLQNWCTENAFIGSPMAETLIIDDFYETLVSG